MKKRRIQLLQWLVGVAANHRRARQAAQALLLLEIAGVSWYNPLWHFRNSVVFLKRIWHVIKVEMRGYPKPIKHENPEVKICKDFVCQRSETHACANGVFQASCLEHCFGIEYQNGVAVSKWKDYYGHPTWLSLSCRNCTLYLTSCKGLNPKYLFNEPDEDYNPQPPTQNIQLFP
ncbi:MAG: hypothetical protein SFU91_06610 [Chloroherpetonaceae bacterium]|nr:hypothetical protein [Chloroherpetonaceae bacterium]